MRADTVEFAKRETVRELGEMVEEFAHGVPAGGPRWRGNLAISGPFLTKWVVVGIEGIYSNNLHQQSPLDLNFNGQQQFVLTSEGSRPVFAAAGSIGLATSASSVDTAAAFAVT